MAIMTAHELFGRARLAAALVALLACPACVTKQPSALASPAAGTDDTSIRHAILAQYQADHPDSLVVPDISVTQGLVVLGGSLPSAMARVDAVREAWDVPGVHQVIDEVKTPPAQDASYARDTKLSMKLRGRLTFDPDINSTHYSIETVAGTIYIMGVAQSQAELDKVNKLTTGTGAKKVVNTVHLAPSADTGGKT
jgi:osmotically-inducible protein OsmY